MIDQFFIYAAGFSCAFAVFAYIYKILRLYWKIKVNCWFCNKNSKVQYKFSNSFICPFCDQYNGFQEDGDYNCTIPAQYSEIYNHSPVKLHHNSLGEDKSKFDNGFCEPCNFNQALKIRAISEFSSNTSEDGEELEKFRERLEEIYCLCQQCEAVLHQRLGKQNSWLKPLIISYRLMQTKANALKSPLLKKYKSSYWKLFHSISIFVCVCLCVISMKKYVPTSLQPYQIHIEKHFLELDLSYSALLGAGIALQGLLVILFQERICKIKNMVCFLGWGLLLLIERCSVSFSASDFQHLKFVSNLCNTILVAWGTRKMFANSTSSKTKLRKSPRNSCVSREVSPDASLYTPSIPSNESLDSFTSSQPQHPIDPIGLEEKKKPVQEDLDTDLLSLKISTPKKSSAPFSPQNLFRENSSCKSGYSSPNVLQPSKFGKHFITQASWVAGGYWGSPGSPQRGRLTSQNMSELEPVKPKPVFSLSRSSSQSSGFVSQLSECASSKSHQNLYKSSPKQSHSQQSSLTGDTFGRESVYSWGGGSPLNSVASFASLRQNNLESLEAQSACSASSFYSEDNSRLHRSTPTRAGSFYYDTSSTNLSPNLPLDIGDRFSSVTCKANIVPSYLYVGVSFVLGLSVSANIFLIFILSQYDLFVK